MNKIFVTGPTGTQGFPIVKELLAKGLPDPRFRPGERP